MRALLVTLLVGAVVAGGITGVGMAVEAGLPLPTEAQLVRVGAAGWFVRDRMAEATVWNRDTRPFRTRCISGSFPLFGHRHLSGTDVLVLGRGAAVINARDRPRLFGLAHRHSSRWGLEELVLAGCPDLVGGLVAAAAHERSARVVGARLAGVRVLAIRVVVRHAPFTIFVRSRTFKPVAVTAASGGARSRIALMPLTRAQADDALDRVLG